MRGGTNALLAALAVLLIAVGLAACGGGSDSSSDTSAPAGQGQEESSGDEAQAEGDEAAGFTPEKHHDSGGGSSRYEVKGGDNSVQEFGQEADPEEFDAAAAALHDFLDARAEGNWEAVCSFVSEEMIESFEKLVAQAKQVEDKSCAGILEQLTNPAARQLMKDEAAAADVRSLRVQGDRAFLIYTATKGAVLAMPMAKEGEGWKVASLAGTPLS